MDFKALRAKRNDKARSLIESSGGKVDSSDWTPAEPLNADAKTGMRPISRRAFKTGGKVEGAEAKTNLSRAPRGFQEKVGLANTNQKDANEEREGVKHVGGMKNGGRAGKMGGGLLSNSPEYKMSAAKLDAVGPTKTGEDMEPKGTINGRKVSDKQAASFTEAQKQQAAWEAEQRAKGDMTRRASGGRTQKAVGGGSDDKYVEGKDYKWVKGGNTNAKVRHFFTKDEKAAMAAPAPAAAPAAPKKAAASMAPSTSPMPPKRPVTNVMQPPKITSAPLPEDTAAAAMKAFGRPQGMPNVDVMGNATGYKKGGMAKKWEGSAKDEMQDKKLAKKRGMSMKEWEASKADEKHDSQHSMKGLKNGGGLYANINAKRDRGEKMRKPGEKGAPSAKDFKDAAKTAKHDEGCSCKACGGRMGRATGGRTKGTTNISINVMPHTANKPMGIQPPMPTPPVGGPPPMGAMPPPPPPGGGGLPPGLMEAMSGAAGANPPPAGPPPMMGRKDGGKVYPKMRFGAGSGEGRLEKIQKYGKNA